jgi:hypothetical protein
VSVKSRLRTAISVISFLLAGLLHGVYFAASSSATEVSTTIASVYLDAPMVQGSYAMRHGGQMQDFNNLSGVISSGTITIGTVSSGAFRIGTSSSYGASVTTETATITANPPSYPGSNYATVDSGTVLTFSTAVKYVGFHWQAGNDGNVVTFRSGTTDLASLSSTNVRQAIGRRVNNQGEPFLNAGDYTSTYQESITSTDGTVYLKKRYFGNPKFYTSLNQQTAPTTGYDREPYAYIHAFASEGESFSSIRFSGGGFELDNLVISTQEVPIRNSLVLNQTATTNLTLGESAWNFRGVTTSDSSTVSTGWVSDSSTATTSSRISLQQDLTISATGTITMGRTALFQAPLTDNSGLTCGTYSLVESYTATDGAWLDINITDTGPATRTRLVRGNCYAWTLFESSNYGSGAVRPTHSAASTRFNSNLESPRLIIPKLPDVKIPRTIPADPRKTSLAFPQTRVLQGSGQVQACFYENDGSVLNGPWGTRASTQNLTFTSGNTSGNVFIATSFSEIPTLFRNLEIKRINGSKFSVDRYVLVRLAPYLGTGFSTNCTGSGSSNNTLFSSNLWPTSSDVFLIHLKPMSLTQTRTFIVPLKNGRQSG